jgi:hypothetical protein
MPFWVMWVRLVKPSSFNIVCLLWMMSTETTYEAGGKNV